MNSAAIQHRSISDCMDGLLPDLSTNGGFGVLQKEEKRRFVRGKKRAVPSKPQTVTFSQSSSSSPNSQQQDDGAKPSSPRGENSSPSPPRSSPAIAASGGAMTGEIIQRFYALTKTQKSIALLSTPSSRELTMKHPKGSTLLSLSPTFLSASYPDGSIALSFDQYGNGNINTAKNQGGTTILSLSAKQCIFFPPKKLSAGGGAGKGGGEIRHINEGSRTERIKLSDQIGVDFKLPFNVTVYIRCKDLHVKVFAPARGGSTTFEDITGKGDLFGEKERVAAVKETKYVPLEMGDRLTAIQKAVAGL